jgi:hypothetical protein
MNVDDAFSNLEDMLREDGYTNANVVIQALYLVKDSVHELVHRKESIKSSIELSVETWAFKRPERYLTRAIEKHTRMVQAVEKYVVRKNFTDAQQKFIVAVVKKSFRTGVRVGVLKKYLQEVALCLPPDCCYGMVVAGNQHSDDCPDLEQRLTGAAFPQEVGGPLVVDLGTAIDIATKSTAALRQELASAQRDLETKTLEYETSQECVVEAMQEKNDAVKQLSEQLAVARAEFNTLYERAHMLEKQLAAKDAALRQINHLQHSLAIEQEGTGNMRIEYWTREIEDVCVTALKPVEARAALKESHSGIK